MKRALIRFALLSASCCLLAGDPSLPADAATAVAPTNVTDAFDASVCPWRVAYDADVHAMSPATASAYAPLVAALCAMFGN